MAWCLFGDVCSVLYINFPLVVWGNNEGFFVCLSVFVFFLIALFYLKQRQTTNQNQETGVKATV